MAVQGHGVEASGLALHGDHTLGDAEMKDADRRMLGG